MESVLLKSGRTIAIRPITADDGAALRASYERLSERSKYQRFLGPKPFLSASDVRYLTEIDGSNHFALVATRVDDPSWIIGVGRFVRLRDDPSAAEFAIVVGDPYQGEGIATELLNRLAVDAAAAGVERVTATMLAGNVPAHRLMRRLAADWRLPGQVAALTFSERHAGITDDLEIALAA